MEARDMEELKNDELQDGNNGRSRGPSTDLGLGEMDLEMYASYYTGYTKIIRLHFIADRSACQQLALEALRIAYDYSKESGNIRLYEKSVDMIGGRLGTEYALDKEWVEREDLRVRQLVEKLHLNISECKKNNYLEGVRKGFIDLGDCFYTSGDVQQAQQSYLKAQDYCRAGTHNVATLLKIIRTEIDLGHLAAVPRHILKVEKYPGSGDTLVQGMLRSTAGLWFLQCKDYKVAALKFTGTPFLPNRDVIGLEDVAVFGALCALATFRRAELKRRVIDSADFQMYMELVPEVRELVEDFYRIKYSSALNQLQRLKPNLELDIHFHPHVSTIFQQIRENAMLQYLTPYISVDLETMARAFSTSVADLQTELEVLISTKKLSNARIDPHRKIMTSKRVDQRTSTFQNVVGGMSKVEQGLRVLLLRASMKKDNLVVK